MATKQFCVLTVVVTKKPHSYTHATGSCCTHTQKTDEMGTRPVDLINVNFLVLILDIIMCHSTTGGNWGKGTKGSPYILSCNFP